jgi:transcriptional regulator with XRE-family HTH domain
MDQGREWAAQSAKTIGWCVANYRADLEISAQQLADRCAELGMPSLSRTVITKLENGRREVVSTAELQVLAMALAVPAILLLFPLGRADTVEVLPGRHVDPYAAMEWFTGDSRDPADPNAPPQGGTDSPIILWNEHIRWDGLIPVLRERAEGGHGPAERATERTNELDLAVAALRRVRAGMHTLGMRPPALHPVSAGLLGEKPAADLGGDLS